MEWYHGDLTGGIFRYRLLELALLPFLLFPVFGRATAQEYHPLTIGSQWEYFSTVSGTELMSIDREEEILGTITRVRRTVDDIQTVENFLTQDSAGSLFLHGARNLTFGVEWAYVPPIRMVDAPLSLDKAWVTEGVVRYNLDGTPIGDEPMDFPFRVYTEGSVTVPAGEFYAYGVGWDIAPVARIRTSAGDFDFLGRHLGTRGALSDNATDWYSVGVGLVIHTTLQDEQLGYRLVSYALPPVPTRNETWSGIKALFR